MLRSGKLCYTHRHRLLKGGRLISHVGNGGGESMAITHETMSLMIQFGGFIVGLLSLVVAIVALTQKKK
ncbi:putative holin-like toxin [Brevibacillus sp. NL20B1]|nr:putative holin-like toxin [Brevibacillus sp. NL20B1]